mgnify:FL=1|tara:strand:+ start:4906 stop:5523 length:618 start_codon:yes stop_codon:yes gene_type:complete
MLKRLPDLFYNFSSRPLDSDYLLVKNIWRRAQILVEYKTQVTLFTEENVRDGERPEDIATRLYRNPFYNWTILVINDITDVYSQWPKSVQQLQDFINQKYSNPMATKHHVTTEVKDANNNIIVPAGKVVPSNYSVAYYNGSTTITATPVVSITNATYETELNSKKQNIQVVKPDLIEDFVSVYYDIANKGKNEVSVTSAADITMN